MPVAQLGVLDLSAVTGHLVSELDTYVQASPVLAVGQPKPKVSGKPPDALRTGAECELSLYLFHVDRDRFYQNTPANGLGTLQIPFQPLALNLYYLLSAYAPESSEKEQQAMSIALRFFHDNPIVRTTIVVDGAAVPQEYTLTMQVQTSDELSRLWQATTVSMRLSAVYRVSVVFIAPDVPTRTLAPRATRISLGADPTPLPFAATGQVTGTRRSVTYKYPSGAPAIGKAASYDLSPATAAAGQRIQLVGGGLNQATSRRVYLVAPDKTEQEVSAWRAPNPAPPTSVLQTASLITLDLPPTTGPAPGSTPPPGLYQLCVGSDVASGDQVTIRSNKTPFCIAPLVTVTADPPVLTPAGGVYTITGLGFSAAGTQLLVGTVALLSSAGGPAAGEFQLDAAGTAISFRLPTALPPGSYPVRIRVNDVESDPGWWVEVP